MILEILLYFFTVSAHATKCLSQASEIEVETGPYFGGKITSENGFCGIKGNPKDPRDVYTMQIDHEKCGSTVNTENLTVETFIVVQENMGILTHSTRRFLVVCTFHPDMLTVRASFSVPGRGGATAVSPDLNSNNGRNARERSFRLVNKSALVLKENDPDRDEGVDSLTEVQQDSNQEIRPSKVTENLLEKTFDEHSTHVQFSRLVADEKHEDIDIEFSQGSYRL